MYGFPGDLEVIDGKYLWFKNFILKGLIIF